MEVTYIMTEDGRTKIEWWPKEKFAGRVTKVISSSSYQQIPIPDDVILCDFCNERITEFPVPVMGTYALCKVCFKNIQKGGNNEPKDEG